VRASAVHLIGEQRFSGRDLGTGEGMPAERILVRPIGFRIAYVGILNADTPKISFS